MKGTGLKEKQQIINVMFKCLVKEANKDYNWLLRYSIQNPKEGILEVEHLPFAKVYKMIKKHVTEDIEDLKPGRPHYHNNNN